MIQILAFAFLTLSTVQAAPAKQVYFKSTIVPKARALLQREDYLGFRIWVRKSYLMKIRHSEWYDLKNLIAANAGKAGFDLIPFWNARNAVGKADIDLQLEKVDNLMHLGKYEAAFEVGQAATKKLKQLASIRPDAKRLLPYVYHSMGQALYGAGRFDDALKVYQWISPNYPFFRQILFEKMWAAFKDGRVDLALGAIASQRSTYFSKYLSPESYLLQTYLYKRLCREDDLKQVIAEMKNYEDILTKGSLKDWVNNDVGALTLWHVSEIKPNERDDLATANTQERASEQAQIKEALQRVYEKQRPGILNDLKAAVAYAHLASVTDTKSVLKPVKSLKSRDELLKQNLEVWPANSNEEWLDEVGKHVLVGESLCNQQKH